MTLNVAQMVFGVMMIQKMTMIILTHISYLTRLSNMKKQSMEMMA